MTKKRLALETQCSKCGQKYALVQVWPGALKRKFCDLKERSR